MTHYDSTFMRRLTLGTVCFGAVTTLWLSGAASANEAQPVAGVSTDPVIEVHRLVEGLDSLAPYVSGLPGSQVLDVDAASAAGIDSEMVALGAEVCASQNAAIANTQGGARARSTTTYPRLEHMHDVATAAAESARTGGAGLSDQVVVGAVPAAASAHVCGNYDYPLPSSSPKRYTISGQGNIETYFTKQGFHPTAGYACGASNPLSHCASDWTQSRSYANALGVCAAPAFRNQGYETGTLTGWIQYGEPNPEIAGYNWPYWNWGSYVQWWHNTY